MSLSSRLAQAEKALIKVRGSSSWACVIMRPGESPEAALQRYPEAAEAQRILFINTGAVQPADKQAVDQQIEKTIQELLRAGVSRGEIDSIIAETEKSTS